MYRWLVFVLMVCFGCQKENSFSGTYFGSWYSTDWEFQFYRNQIFTFSGWGHFGDGTWEGTYRRNGDTLWLQSADSLIQNAGFFDTFYLIDGDSCIIDYSSTFDYCKTRKWSKRRAIRYPQLPTDDSTLIADLHWMLQTALNSTTIAEAYADAHDTLVLESYYTIDENYPFEITHLGRPISVVSYEQIKEQNLDEWIMIELINCNHDGGFMAFQIMPWKVSGDVIARFWKENSEWKYRIID